MTTHGLDRRQALGLGAWGGLTLVSTRAHGAVRLWASPALGPLAAPRTLLVLQLAGGNDGLSTVVPFADDGYHRERPGLGIDGSAVLKLDDYRGLHPALKRTKALYDEGQLAIVEGAGYPNPIRSHFRSFDVWHAADERGRAVPEGWVGRLCGCAFEGSKDPNLVVHVGGAVPYSLHSTRHPPVSFVTPTGYRWAGSRDEVDAYAKAAVGEEARKGGEQASNLDFLRGVLADGQSSSEAIRRAAARYETSVAYPQDAFGAALRDVAALVNGGLGTRVYSLELAGFDTHNDQRNRHDQLMGRLDEGLGAFLEDAQKSEAGRNVVVLVFSEFGRRVRENGSRGTDHGAAGPMFVAGAAVKGGLYGKHPSLAELEDGDLAHTTDFRSVYGTLIERWFGVERRRVLGQEYPLLPIV